MVPLTACMERIVFGWTLDAERSFQLVKNKMIKDSMSALSDFDKIFDVYCGASGVSTDAVLSQEGCIH